MMEAIKKNSFEKEHFRKKFEEVNKNYLEPEF